MAGHLYDEHDRTQDFVDLKGEGAGNDATQNYTQDSPALRESMQKAASLSDADLADVLCILHPSGHPADRIVADTALRNIQHVLQNKEIMQQRGSSQIPPSQQETFLVDVSNARDLALRFSSRVNDPALGFCFGRNPLRCDIILDIGEQARRISNTHFRIFVNSEGVLMLEDMSTNGTMVDNVVLKCKDRTFPKAQMLDHGSIIQIIFPEAKDVVKFMVHFPNRGNQEHAYRARFQAYMNHIIVAKEKAREVRQDPNVPDATTRKLLAAPLAGPPNRRPYLIDPPLNKPTRGMHWDGGEKYGVVGQLGRGAFAIVYRLIDKATQVCVAAKELEKRRFVKNGILDVRIDNEMRIMKELRHQSIVQYVDFKETEKHLYIIMEYIPGGDLQGYIQLHGTLAEPLARDMTHQMMHALAYLHEKGITHRDIKPDNILIWSEDPFVTKLTDFGLSKVIKDETTFLTTFCGTLLYCAPEVFPDYAAYVSGHTNKRRRNAQNPPSSHRYSQSVDIWSYAAVLWYVLSGKPPIEPVTDSTGRAMFHSIMESRLDRETLVEHAVSGECIDFLVRMLNIDPMSRPTEQECLRHPWLNDGKALPPLERIAGLDQIAEEDEELDASQLSIQDYRTIDPVTTANSSDEDLRQSKRYKPNNVRLYEGSQSLASSDASSFAQSIPIVNDVRISQFPIPPTSKPARLFGEISEAAGNPAPANESQRHHSPAMAHVTSHANGAIPATNNVTNGNHSHNPDEPNRFTGAESSASLLGAESMVRELQMGSPGTSRHARIEKLMPRTPSGSFLPLDHLEEDPDKTPKQQMYNRRIDFHEFGTEEIGKTQEIGRASIKEPSLNASRSLPPTEHSSYHTFNEPLAGANKENENLAPATAASGITTVHPTDSGFVKPATRLGRLTSTPDSFISITLPISQRITTWGRNPHNTFVYPDSQDTRVPKTGIELWFHAKGIDDLDARGTDWTKLDGLHTILRTRSSKGLWVNGVHLHEKNADGNMLYGRVHTGDEIVVSALADGSRLAFTLQIFHGEGAKSRGVDVDGEARFTVQESRAAAPL